MLKRFPYVDLFFRSDLTLITVKYFFKYLKLGWTHLTYKVTLEKVFFSFIAFLKT